VQEEQARAAPERSGCYRASSPPPGAPIVRSDEPFAVGLLPHSNKH